MVTYVIALVLTRKGRRRADAGNPRLLRAVPFVGAGVGALGALSFARGLLAEGWFPQSVELGMLVAAALWTLAHVRVLLATSNRETAGGT